VGTERKHFNPIDEIIRKLRARSVSRSLPRGARILDVGCGQTNSLIRSGGGWAADSLGIDPSLREEFTGPNGRRTTVSEVAMAEPASFDGVVSLAVIEHIEPGDVESFVGEMVRCLKPGGTLVLTTPSRRAKPLLEFLAFRLRLISADEIRDHKQYFARDQLVDLVARCGLSHASYQSFMFGCNQRVVASRR
jgi:2-polyprenyl-3-methyl-5-hydroxy-6-metoxy-1,4-benzoquinol methylase